MKRILALLLCLVSLTACASMLEREYTETSPHQEDPPLHDGTTSPVENYTMLCSTLLSYVERGTEEGLLRVPTTYRGDLNVDLEKARQRLLDEEPLGYYVRDLKYTTSKIIAYYEVEVHFTYRVDTEILAHMERVPSRPSLLIQLSNSVERRQEELHLYMTVFPERETEAYFQDALEEVWEKMNAMEAEDPDAEVDLEEMPGLEVELYPQTGTRRVAVLHFTYPEEEGGRAW